MSQFKIDKNIPMPAGWGKIGTGEYPFALLEVGDSFFVPSDYEKNIQSICSYVRNKYKDKRFSTRILIENGVKGTRIWRTS